MYTKGINFLKKFTVSLLLITFIHTNISLMDTTVKAENIDEMYDLDFNGIIDIYDISYISKNKPEFLRDGLNHYGKGITPRVLSIE